MNKGKFASLITLGSFKVRVVPGSAVSAHTQGYENLAIVADIGVGSYNDSVAIDSKVSNESATVANDDKSHTDRAITDEETKTISTDDSNIKAYAENIDQSTENKTKKIKILKSYSRDCWWHKYNKALLHLVLVS